MTKELYDSLQALCYMWDQYCSGPSSHMFMSAGEHTEEVLDYWELLEHKDGIESAVKWDRLEILRLAIKEKDNDHGSELYEF
jgi:hypothetical protein